MPQHVTNGATLQCSFGLAPSTLVVLPVKQIDIGNQPAATIMDHKPMTNIMPFGLCRTPSNPVVAAATTAALGVLTPMPCIPATSSPWTPGSTISTVRNEKALLNTCKLLCQWGGVITVTNPGQTISSGA